MLGSALKRTAVALVLLLLAASLRADSERISRPLPPEIADCKVYRIWQFANSPEGWRPDHNVGAFSVKNGILSFTNTGSDPWILITDLGAPDTSRYGRVGIKMRSSARGSNQVYFATDKSNMGESGAAASSARGDGKFHFYEIDLSQLASWTGKLTTLRIDPVNGGWEIGAKVDIYWIALYQTPAKITLGRPKVYLDKYGVVRVDMLLRNTGGEQTSPDMTVSVNGDRQMVEPIRPREARTITLQGDTTRNIIVKGQARGKTLFVADLAPTWTTVGRGWSVANIHFEGPDGRVSRAIISSNEPPLWPSRLPEGEFRPLATLVYRDGDGILHYDELTADAQTMEIKGYTATFSGKHKLAAGSATIKWTFALPGKSSGGEIGCELTADKPVEVLRFEGPRLQAFGDKTHALFPGLQYLEANEPYTASAFIGSKLADQHIPHPYKIAVPVMAVETKDGIIGLSWDPLQEWVPGHALPSAQFEPDRQLMTIFAPSIPEYVDENQDYARTPYTLLPGKKLTLKMSFFVDPGKKITDVIPDYFAAHGLPKAPPIAGGIEGTIETCFKAYTQSLYSKEAKGWKNHFGLGQSYSPNPNYASLILAESFRKSKPELARGCGIDPNAQLAQYTGIPLDWFTDGARAGADAAIARQSPDGGFPYTITEDMSKRILEFKPMSGVDATTLGTVGETNSGLIARELGGILDYAVRTGEKKYVDAGLLGLSKLNTFTVPRGAQTWEVHAHAPDVYAAALCVNVNIAGYHLTRDDKYLDYARFWAQTGLPFVYSWAVPISDVPDAVLHFDENGEGKNPILDKSGAFYSDTRRYINPGATIAVFGSSFYFVNWFGTPVQWCGLVWANSVRAYTKLRPDPVLQAVADSVFASATQQQFDKGFAAGTYPDSWNLASNTASTAFIAPDSIISYAYSLIGEKTPSGVSTESFRTPSGVARLNTFASIERVTCGPSGLAAALKFYGNQDVYACLAPVDSPTSVKVAGKSLAAAADLRTAASGFYYDSAARALHVKYRVPSRTTELSVKWAQ